MYTSANLWYPDIFVRDIKPKGKVINGEGEYSEATEIFGGLEILINILITTIP